MGRRFTKNDGTPWSFKERTDLSLLLLKTVATADNSRTIIIDSSHEEVREALGHNNFTSNEVPVRRY